MENAANFIQQVSNLLQPLIVQSQAVQAQVQALQANSQETRDMVAELGTDVGIMKADVGIMKTDIQESGAELKTLRESVIGNGHPEGSITYKLQKQIDFCKGRVDAEEKEKVNRTQAIQVNKQHKWDMTSMVFLCICTVGGGVIGGGFTAYLTIMLPIWMHR